MRDFKAYRSPRQTLIHFWGGVGVIAVLGLITFGAGSAAWGMYGKFTEAAQGDAQAQAQLASLESQQTHMSAAVADLSTPRGVEAQVRERYGVEKPGEGVIQIVDESGSSTPAAQQRSWLASVWEAFFGWL